MIFRLIDEELVMHMTDASVVLSMPIETSESDKRQVENVVELTTGTARAPSANDAHVAPRNAG